MGIKTKIGIILIGFFSLVSIVYAEDIQKIVNENIIISTSPITEKVCNSIAIKGSSTCSSFTESKYNKVEYLEYTNEEEYKGLTENKSLRTENSKTFKTGRLVNGKVEYVMKIYGNDFQTGEELNYEIKEATTTEEILIRNNLLNDIWGINKANALTNSTSTNNGDVWLDSSNPTTNNNSLYYSYIGSWNAGQNLRTWVSFTTPNIDGEITEAKLYLYKLEHSTSNCNGRTIDLMEVTRNDVVEAQATYNIYKTGSNWTTAGGDFENEAISSKTLDGSANGYYYWLTQNLEFNTRYDWIFKDSLETTADCYWAVAMKEQTNTNQDPYLEITYVEETPLTGEELDNDTILSYLKYWWYLIVMVLVIMGGYKLFDMALHAITGTKKH